MYNDELEARPLSLAQLFLDPNNPRFSNEREKPTPEAKIPDVKIQEKTQKRIEEFGVKEVRDSILRNGFLPMDRIVVRPINGHGEKYVVVEGNRRLAALKSLHRLIQDGEINEEGIDEEYLEKLKDSTQTLEVLLYKGTSNDISWRLQGIRHISGIKEWSPAQQAILVARLVDEGKSFTEVGQQFGLSGKAIGRLYRVHKALNQMRSDDEYGDKAQNDQFTLFDEAYKHKEVRNWLGWNEDDYKYKNTSDLKQFYSWIVPDEEHEDKQRRIKDPRHMRYLAELLEKKRTDLLGNIERHEMTIEEAWGNINAISSNNGYDWTAEIDKAKKAVNGLPFQIFQEQPEPLKAALDELLSLVEKALTNLVKLV
ncbi:MAG: ParB N-terminal domain-containing protein [Nostoc sp.]|uniref:ParB N-terminal domain-containing protein n=1 Tax=Nostoc sp. TaxID=1180 RepID=UPI002FF60C4C